MGTSFRNGSDLEFIRLLVVQQTKYTAKTSKYWKCLYYEIDDVV